MTGFTVKSLKLHPGFMYSLGKEVNAWKLLVADLIDIRIKIKYPLQLSKYLIHCKAN